eukprot:TRINITY_DN59054_c0_g1_i1.p1 TRINITY_DN59054_c0_g1~~TRINITY_DN59054_c0_g1_i1.p1  ORF type:complete len:448 (-),score=79.70 TRINITY_DN59054_c0_g1_i1:4-1347(-)
MASTVALHVLGFALVGPGSPDFAIATPDATAQEPFPSAVWMAPILNAGGYSSEAQSYALALDKEYSQNGGSGKFGLRQFAEQQNHDFVRGLPASMREALSRLLSTGMRQNRWDIAICHATPDVWHDDGAFGWGSVQPCPPRRTQISIGRTMYETDRLPKEWVPRISAMDEVWVPSHFAIQQFVSSGVPREKIVVVPEPVDTELFDPSAHKPLDFDIDDSNLFRFLSVFKWEKRKGWDMLLKSYFEEFTKEDPVVLVVKTQAFHSGDDFHQKLEKHLSDARLATPAGREPARVKVLSEDLPLRELPRIYRGADAFVLPSRGEGWGRPHVEAMSMGLPVIATNWSGSTEFLDDDCSLPLGIDGLEPVEEGQGPKGHLWAVPSAKLLRELMRWVLDHKEEARRIGKAARKRMVERFSPESVVKNHVLPHLQRLGKSVAHGKGKGGRSTEL